jgi:5-oxoprolinase (ATP-hydrolysing)
MTNSRLTDIEVLEQRYPVTVETFSVRNGSGGHGRWHGGDGVIRALRFHDSMTVSFLGNNHRHAPFGLRGGGWGESGLITLERANGTRQRLHSAAEFPVGPGDRVIVHTPGGGGFGSAF